MSKTSTVKRIASSLPASISAAKGVKKTVGKLDVRERRLRRALNKYERLAKRTRKQKLKELTQRTRSARAGAFRQLDQLLDQIGLVRKSAHETALRKARRRKAAKKRTVKAG